MRPKSRRARRCPSPVVCTAAAVIEPPKISHHAVDWKPAKMIPGLATWKSIASRKNSSVTDGSGNSSNAQADMAKTTRMAA